jgi:hypothetical protein
MLIAYSASAIWMPPDGYGLSLVYARTSGGKMNVTIEDNGEDGFANGQSRRELRDRSDANGDLAQTKIR